VKGIVQLQLRICTLVFQIMKDIYLLSFSPC
jgi:hypothetical protein